MCGGKSRLCLGRDGLSEDNGLDKGRLVLVGIGVHLGKFLHVGLCHSGGQKWRIFEGMACWVGCWGKCGQIGGCLSWGLLELPLSGFCRGNQGIDRKYLWKYCLAKYSPHIETSFHTVGIMRKLAGIIALGVLSLTCAVAFAHGRPGDPQGIRLVEAKPKTNVYEIKLMPPVSAEQAHYLDQQLVSKQGIWSSQTNHQTLVCRLEAVKALETRDIQEVIDHSGFSISKSFEQ